MNPSPRVFTEAPGTPMTPSSDRSNPKRVIRSADGDDLTPAPRYNPERPTRRQEFPGSRSDAPEKGKDQPRYTPREFPGQNNNPNESRPEPRKEYRPERSDRREGGEESKPDFKPERIRREAPNMERTQDPSPKIDLPREKPRDSYQPPRESRPEPRSERRQEMNTNSGSRSENNRSSGDGRRSPR